MNFLLSLLLVGKLLQTGPVNRPAQIVYDSVVTIHRIERAKVIYLSSDLLLDAFDELNCSTEVQISNKVALGIEASEIYPNPAFARNPFAPRQRDWPGTIYSGYGIRGYIKLFRDKDRKIFYKPGKFKRLQNRNPYWYFGVGYKTTSYPYQTFKDELSSNDLQSIWTSSSATDKIFDFCILHGVERYYVHNIFTIDYSCGLGIRSKYENKDTYSSVIGSNYTPGPFPSDVPLGIGKNNYIFPFPVFSLKVGINLVRAKKQTIK